MVIRMAAQNVQNNIQNVEKKKDQAMPPISNRTPEPLASNYEPPRAAKINPPQIKQAPLVKQPQQQPP